MTDGCRIAIAGATGLAGEAVLEVLAERELPVAELHLLASERALGREISFRGESFGLQDLAAFDFSASDLVVFTVPDAIASRYVPVARAAGCAVIDTSGAFRADADVPQLVPGLAGGQGEDAAAAPRLVVSPTGAAVVLAHVLAPLQALVGLERVDIVGLEAMSGAGRDAVEELASQCAQLLNGRPLASGQQLAFNVLPATAPAARGKPSAAERELAQALAAIVGIPATNVSVMLTRVPVFFGDGYALRIHARAPLSAAAARAALTAAGTLDLSDEAPTPVSLGERREAIAVGRIRSDPGSDRILDLWVVADNVRRGLAVNTVDIVEVLERECF